MRKTIGLVAMLALWAGIALGQNPVRFRSTETFGLSSGSAGSYFQLQSVNGVSRGLWFAGLGAGVDYYRFRSVPLFLSVTRDLAVDKRDWLFLYLDGGTNLPWYKRPAGSLITPEGAATSVFHSGEYWSGGLGYLWKLGEHSNKAVLLSVGYTVKKLSEDQTALTPGCPLAGFCPVTPASTVVYEYLCRAYQLMIGFRF
jgi:hypothetical protein